jgi:hypothetical protein
MDNPKKQSRQEQNKQTKTQYNMRWTPPLASKNKTKANKI